jgi:hypothetical protein
MDMEISLPCCNQHIISIRTVAEVLPHRQRAPFASPQPCQSHSSDEEPAGLSGQWQVKQHSEPQHVRPCRTG